MNAHEKALRDAFLAECWRPCPEWHSSARERKAAAERNALLDPVDEPGGNVEKGVA